MAWAAVTVAPAMAWAGRGAGNGVGGGDSGAGNGVVRARSGIGGHGLAGLAERARPLNGTVVAGALDGGGFRLAVTVPVPTRRA